MLQKVSTTFLACVFVFSALYTPARADAALISDQQIDSQKREVLVSVVQTLQQHVRLLQMVLIQRLEIQVATLRTQVEKR